MHRRSVNERFSRIFEELTEDVPTESTVNHQRDLAFDILRMVPLDEIRMTLAHGAKIDAPVMEGLHPLHFAIFQNYRKAAKFFISRDCNLNVLDNQNYAPLHIAAETGCIEMVELLLDHGAQLNFQGDVPQPLHLAIRNNHLEVVKMLLDRGADAEIDLVADLEYLGPLLESGANANSRDRSGLSPLMKAARQPGGMEAAMILLKFGANVNGMSEERNDYKTVLHYAILSGNYPLIELLIKRGANPNYHEKYDLRVASPLDLAILKGDCRVVKLLIDSGANVNWSSPVLGAPLHVASSDNIPNSSQIIQMLLEVGADPNPRVFHNKFDRKSQLRPPLAEYLASNRNPSLAVVTLLLKYGARVVMKTQFRDPNGILNHLYNIVGSGEMFSLLLEASESFDVFMIRRDKVLKMDQRAALLAVAENPLSLKRQVRLFLRRFLGGRMLVESIGSFKLPQHLAKYLLFDKS